MSRRVARGLPGGVAGGLGAVGAGRRGRGDNRLGRRIGVAALASCFAVLVLWVAVSFTHPHVGHEVTAQLDVWAEWAAVHVREGMCEGSTAAAMPLLARLSLVNPSFSEGSKGWKAASGRPSIGVEEDGNRFWQGGRQADGGIECSEQVVPLTQVTRGSAHASTVAGVVAELGLADMALEGEGDSEALGRAVDAATVLLHATVRMKRPPKNQMRHVKPRCGYRNHFCEASFNDQPFVALSYLAAGQEGSSGGVLGTLRTVVEDSDAWVQRQVRGLVPAGTEAIRVSVCSSHRAGTTNDGGVDDVAVELLYVPHAIRHATCRIGKAPMLRLAGEEEGRVAVVWETDDAVHVPVLEWGWSREELEHSEAVETTLVDACHAVHKATICHACHSGPASRRLFYRVRCGTSTKSPVHAYELPLVGAVIQGGRGLAARSVPPPAKHTVCVIGDNQYGASVMRHLVHDVADLEPDLLFMAGDIVNRGYEVQEWAMYFWHPLEVAAFAQMVPVVLTRGNHDGEFSLSYAFTATPAGRDWFAFSRGMVRYIVLNSNAEPRVCPMQTQWLKEELASDEAANALFVVVMFHLPPYTELWSPKEAYNGEEFVRDDWVPLFEQHGVDLVINGHTHAYMRGERNGVVYTIVGGAGGMVDEDQVHDWHMFDVTLKIHHYVLLEVAGCSLSWTVYDMDRQVVDEMHLAARRPHPAIACPLADSSK